MDLLKVNIKKFLKNKNTITIIAVLLCLIILYYAYNYRIQRATNPISVPIANRQMEPRTLITSDMVGLVKVPKSMITANVITSSSQVIGKYVSEKAVIPNGSLFYAASLVEWDDIAVSIWADIPEGNTIVALPVTLESTYGNSIFPGNYIDLYFQSNDDTGKLIFGKFIESIKVLAVFDGQGNNVFEKTINVPQPKSLIFSVNEEYHLLLRKALFLSENIIPVPRNADYSLNPSPTAISSSYLQNFILIKTINVSEEDLKDITFGGGGNTNNPNHSVIIPNTNTSENGGNE